MKSLELFVEELLYEHQCVIIPDFGAFVSNRKVAELLKDSTITPPVKEISFNARLNVNDGLLVKRIAGRHQISYEAAQTYIKAQVDKWKYTLDKGEELIVGKVGKFYKGSENSIIFEPFGKENFLTDTFGMGSVQTNKVEKTAPEGNISSSEALNENPMATKEEKKRIFVLPSWGKYAVAAVVGLGIIYYGVYSFLNSMSKPQQVANEDSSKQEKISEASFVGKSSTSSLEPSTDTSVALFEKQQELEKEKENLRKEEERQKQLKEKQTKTASTSEVKNKVTENKFTADSQKYHLVAGAFSSLSNARSKVSELKKDGFKDAVVVGKNAKGLYLVSFKGFDNENQARNYISKVKENGYDTWLYKNN